MNNTNTRIVHTNLYGAQAKAVIDSLRESTKATIQKLEEKLTADVNALLTKQKAEIEKVDKA